jgi:rhamnosyltransferase
MLKISGIVVLYNPDEEVFYNIQTYIDQIDYLYVFDNSEIPNENCKKISEMNSVRYISMKENKGIGYALNYGLKQSIEDKVDYTLTMDQDSKATPWMVSKLQQAMECYEDIVIAAAFPSNVFNTQVPGVGKYIEVIFAKTSGNLVNLRWYKKLGEFISDYFIDYVDIEYGLRIKKNNLKIVQVNDANLIHREANISKKRILWFYVYPMNHAPIRLYYKVRNLLYLRDEYCKIFPDLIKQEIDYFIRIAAKIILFENYKVLKLKMMIRGYLDYRKGIRGIMK